MDNHDLLWRLRLARLLRRRPLPVQDPDGGPGREDGARRVVRQVGRWDALVGLDHGGAGPDPVGGGATLRGHRQGRDPEVVEAQVNGILEDVGNADIAP